jgi:hypothetical protein
MNSMSLKEKIILAATGVVLLYVLTAAVWFMFQRDVWQRSVKNYKRVTQRYASEERLIAKKKDYVAKYDEAKDRMPMFNFSATDTDTKWMRKMDEFSSKYHVVIAQTSIEDEVAAGDVFERTIVVRNFEGSLDALIKFMYELDHSADGAFNMKSLSLKPSSKKGYLKGSFTISCAYMKRDSDDNGGDL